MIAGTRLAAALAAGFFSASVAAQMSASIDALWNYADPAASEVLFRARLAAAAPGSREALELDTQVARAQGLQREFDAAHRTLDGVEAKLASAATRVRVRYLLERGRVYNSAGAPERAVPLFVEASNAALADEEPDAEFYRIDALHMLGIAAPAGERMSWNQQALRVAERAKDPRARGWKASLLNNLGWVFFDRGDPSTALAYWQRALGEREKSGDTARIRIAKWTVARGLRAAGRLDEAESIQIALAGELDRAGKPDGFVFEELAEIAVAKNDPGSASKWAARAYPMLAADASFAAAEPARLARLKALSTPSARPAAPGPGAAK